MRLLKELMLHVLHELRAVGRIEVADAEHQATAIQQNLDRLDGESIYKESTAPNTYERQREELNLVEIDRHGSKVEDSPWGHPDLRRAGATAAIGPLDLSVV